MIHLSDEQRAINAAGTARCRGVVNAIVAARAQDQRPGEPQRPLTETELIHQRAVERAITERRNRRLTTGATA